MTTITGLTKARMLEIEQKIIVGGMINQAGHLILQSHDGLLHDAGYVVGGPAGIQGAIGETGPRGFEGPQGVQGVQGLPSFVPGPMGPPNYIAEISAHNSSYTLIRTDAGKAVEIDMPTPAVITIPPFAQVSFPIGTVLEIYQLGEGQVTIQGGAGVTLEEPDSYYTTRKKFSTIALRCRGNDIWALAGDTVSGVTTDDPA